MQVLFAGSDEGAPLPGLNIIDAQVEFFKDVKDVKTGRPKAVPHMGWNEATPFPAASSSAPQLVHGDKSEDDIEDLYFVHSYAVPYQASPLFAKWTNTTTQYGDKTFVSSVRQGNILACQFHPEKSGEAGLKILKRWLDAPTEELSGSIEEGERDAVEIMLKQVDGFTKRIVACLDVRTNDAGQLHFTLWAAEERVLTLSSFRRRPRRDEGRSVRCPREGSRSYHRRLVFAHRNHPCFWGRCPKPREAG